MTASLADVDAAILQTLEGLLDTNGGVFKSVTRFALLPATGNEQQRAIADETFGNTPSLLLAFEREQYTLVEKSTTIPLRQHLFIGRSFHRVFICHTELAGHDAAMEGQVASPGVFELVSQVVAALAGLPIPDSYQNSRLEPIETVPVMVKPGQYIFMARFRADRLVDATPIFDTAYDLQQVNIDYDVADNAVVDEAMSPLVETDITY